MKTNRNVLFAAGGVALVAVLGLFVGGRISGERRSAASAISASTDAAAPTSVSGGVRSVVSAAPAAAPAVSSSVRQTPTVRGTRPYVLTCATSFNQPLRQVVEAMGARTVGVLGANVVLVEATESVCRRLAADSRFSAVKECLPAEKIQTALAAALTAGAETVEASIIALSAEDRARVIACVEAGGGSILKGCLNEDTMIRATLSASLVASLSRQGEVRWMEKFERPRLMNDLAVDPGAMNVRPVWLSDENLNGLSGAGQIVSTSDTGIDTGDLETLHLDLRGRVLGFKIVDNCETNDVDGHGTHTAGSIVGTGAHSDGKIRGTAWGANLYAWFCNAANGSFLTPETASELFRGDTNGTEWAAFIHSASWGASVNGQYVAECAAIDKFVWEHPDFLPVFSAGNAGAGQRTVGSPAAAKNVLAVGATQNFLHDEKDPELGTQGLSNGDPSQTASYSSRGPCQDGRIKPDIAAPGTGILSTRAHGVDYSYGIYNEYYAFDTGTSMACPLTAGAVALVREWLVTNAVSLGLSETEPPTAALMKAVVTGGAAGAVKPTYEQGWGRVDLENTLFPADRAVKLIDRLPFAQGFVTNIVIETTSEAPLDVQLVWIDYPGDAASGQGSAKLVNNLDLTVEARFGLGDDRTWYGNGGTVPDTLNNVESVRIKTAQATKYVITVSCPNVVYNDGGAAALYIRGAFDPAATPSLPEYVRIRERGLGFRKIERALAEVQAGETIELLDWVRLPSNSVTKTSFTLTATNDVPSRSPILRQDGASLTLGGGARVFFTNIVFETGSSAPVLVSKGSTARVAGTAVFDGLVAGVNGILVAAADGFDLAGRLDNGITVDCEGASRTGNLFGNYSCATSVAVECAPRLVSALETSWAGAANDSGGLFWQTETPVDPAVAVGYVDGDEPVYFRTLDQLFDAGGPGTNLVIQRSGYPLERLRTVSGVQSISAAEGIGEIIVRPGAAAGFRLTAGSDLTVSGLTFRDYAGNALFLVSGADARLTVSNTVFRNIAGTNKWSGAIAVNGGSVRSVDSVFDDCRATGDHPNRYKPAVTNHVNAFGGAIYLKGAGCSLSLEGGAITNCWARNEGGGVYAGGGATVSVRGELKVSDNFINTIAKGIVREENIYFCDGATLTLSGELVGEQTVGVKHSASAAVPGIGNGVSNRFASVGASLDAAALGASAAAFFCDADPEVLRAEPVVDGTVTNLMWVERQPGDNWVDPSDPSAVMTVTKGGVTRYYAEPESAFEWIDADATVELLTNVTFEADLVVTNGVTVRLRSHAPDRFALTRANGSSLCVLAGATLSVTNLKVNGGSLLTSSSLLNVTGGALELQAGASVRDAMGDQSRAAGGVTVCQSGTFTLRSGAEIADCSNAYANDGTEAGYGGGLLIEDASSCCLRGGRIVACRANHGGGAFVGSKSTVRLSGDVTVATNCNFTTDADGLQSRDNLCVADLSSLVVDGELTGAVGYNEGLSGDREVFGTVTFAGTDAQKQSAAHCFTHDVTGDVGMAVSDGTETLLVWSQALDDEGVYGGTHALLDGAPYPVDAPVAVDGLVYDGQTKTGVVAGVGYTLAGQTAAEAGPHVATATLRRGFVWSDGQPVASTNIVWQIGKGYYDLTGITLERGVFTYDGESHSLAISGQLPAGLTVCYSNNLHWVPSTNRVTAIITVDPGAPSPNLVLASTPTLLTNDLVIVDFEGKYLGEAAPPSPEPEYVEPDPIAFQSITRVSETEWSLVVTNRRQWAEYRLIWTEDLSKGFVSTGAWEQAAADGAWATNVLFTAPAPAAVFWKAEGRKGEKK